MKKDIKLYLVLILLILALVIMINVLGYVIFTGETKNKSEQQNIPEQKKELVLSPFF